MRLLSKPWGVSLSERLNQANQRLRQLSLARNAGLMTPEEYLSEKLAIIAFMEDLINSKNKAGQSKKR